MSLTSIFKKEYVVGLDIGSSSVKLVQFVRKEDGPHLANARLQEISPGADNAAREANTVTAIMEIVKGIDLKRSRVIVNVNCPQTAIKKVIAPYMSKAELREGIKLVAKNYFPFPVDGSLIDFEILGDIVEKGIRKYELVVAACPTATVDKYLSLLNKAGVKPASFVISSYSFQSIAVGMHPGKDEANCFIDIGAAYTELIICKGGKLAFSRKLPISGSDFTKAMTTALVSDRGRMQLSLAEAEKIKREIGLPLESDSKLIAGKLSHGQILSMMRTVLEQFAGEIERCFDYYREEAGGAKIDSIILFGGGASLTNLVKLLSDMIGTEVRTGDCLKALKVETNALPERSGLERRLDMAVGAALSETGGINLLPVEVKDQKKRFIKRGTVEAVGTAVIFAFALIYVGMKIQLENFTKRIAADKIETSALQPQFRKAEAMILANKVLADEPQWEDVFMELSNLIPDNIYMTDISMKNKIITMKGVVGAADGEQALSDFIIILEKGIFNNVKLVSSKELAEKAGIEFELKCWIDYEK